MPIWNETKEKLELKGFEDGLTDARRDSVDQLTYQINSRYRTGVDIATALTDNLTDALNSKLHSTKNE